MCATMASCRLQAAGCSTAAGHQVSCLMPPRVHYDGGVKEGERQEEE